MDEPALTPSARHGGTAGLFQSRAGVAIVVTMDPSSPAEELPALYRAILDRVASLEAAGDRAEALRVRSAASKAYSRAWDDRARRQLEALLRRAERPTTAERPRGRPGRSVRPPTRAAAAPDR